MPTKERRDRERKAREDAQKGTTKKDAAKKKVPTKDETTPRRTFARTLPTKVDDEVLLLRSKELAAALARLDEIETEKKGVVADYKAMTDEVEKRVAALRKVVETGKEDQPVECGEFLDYQRKAIIIRRLDNGETVETASMEEKDLQLAMSFPSKKDGDAKAADAPADGASPAPDPAAGGEPPTGGSDPGAVH